MKIKFTKERCLRRTKKENSVHVAAGTSYKGKNCPFCNGFGLINSSEICSNCEGTGINPNLLKVLEEIQKKSIDKDNKIR